ncbi:MAG: 23S rRNA (pseudouridine(1915)-N(3))-methyltransferase RlmH, partial [Pseudomonadota bacterium]
MKITICAVGRLKSGPEAALLADYLERFGKTGRSLGLGPAVCREVEDRKGGGMAAEAALLRGAVPEGAYRIVLDERGKVMTSPDFAARLGALRDRGVRDVALMIGGADG